MLCQLTGDLTVRSQIGVILPTYCESQNVEGLIAEIENLGLDASVLVVDDSSPDKTSEIVRKLQKRYANLLLYVRPQKGGLGSAITDAGTSPAAWASPPDVGAKFRPNLLRNPQSILQLLR